MKPSANHFDRQIGHNLREIRRTAGLSQTDLARHLGISFQQIQKYEKGVNRLPLEKFYRISVWLCVDIKDFFHGIENNDQKRGHKPARSTLDYNPPPLHLCQRIENIKDEQLKTKITRALYILTG